MTSAAERQRLRRQRIAHDGNIEFLIEIPKDRKEEARAFAAKLRGEEAPSSEYDPALDQAALYRRVDDLRAGRDDEAAEILALVAGILDRGNADLRGRLKERLATYDMLSKTSGARKL